MKNFSSANYHTCNYETFPDLHSGGILVINTCNIVLCLVALIMNLYIIFCYYFKRYREPINSHQIFIIVISCLVAFTSFTFFPSELLSGLIANPFIRSFHYRLLVWTRRLDVIFCKAFLSIYRYYRVCKPIRSLLRIFSTRRISLYFGIYLLIVILSAWFDTLVCKFCSQTFISAAFMVQFVALNVIYVFNIAFIIFVYRKIIKGMKNLIRSEMVSLLPQYKDQESASEDTSLKYIYYSQSSPDYLKEEKYYMLTMRVYSLLLVTLLILRYLTWVSMHVSYFYTETYFQPVEVYMFYKMTQLALYFYFFASNIAIFYEHNAEFKVKLRRPLRTLKFPKLPKMERKTSQATTRRKEKSKKSIKGMVRKRKVSKGGTKRRRQSIKKKPSFDNFAVEL